MNDLIARVGQLFLAPAAPVTFAPPRARCATVGVLAPAPDLNVAAGAAAVALRREAGAPVALVCAWRGGADEPLTAPAPALPAASRLAAKLRRRDLAARAAGALCIVNLPTDPSEATRLAQLAMAASDAPAVIAAARREAALDGLLASLDRLVLAPGPATDAVLAALARDDLARLGPAVEQVGVPAAFLARRLATLGFAPAAVPTPASAAALAEAPA